MAQNSFLAKMFPFTSVRLDCFFGEVPDIAVFVDVCMRTSPFDFFGYI